MPRTIPGDPAPARSVSIAIFAISAATVLCQVAFTRIFSASIWYHFAFLVVSIALFGFGASGVFLSLVPREPDRDARLRMWAPALFGATAITAYLGTNAIPFSPFQILRSPIQIVYFLLYDLLLLAPFFFAGTTVALILRSYPRSAGTLYATDLVGAAVGSLLVFGSLPWVGAPGSVVLAAALGLLAAICAAQTRRSRAILSAAAVAVLPLAMVPGILPDVRIDPTKSLLDAVAEPGGRIAYTGWNALSRIDVVERSGGPPIILIDAAARTTISPGGALITDPRKDVSTLAYELRPAPEVAIIGSGGGVDVQNALGLGARKVTAVEINPLIIELVTGRYAPVTGHLFRDPRVELIQDEGRSFIERGERRYDVIQITLIDTWAAGVSGAYSLSENYLYTTEAFGAYLDHLTPGGVLSITRWYYEVPRLASLARAALEARGIEDAASRVLLVQQRNRVLFLFKETPFSESEVAFVRTRAQEQGWEIPHDPRAAGGNPLYLALLGPADPAVRAATLDRLPASLGPVSDDSPFFFQMGRWRDLQLGKLRAFVEGSFLEPLILPVGQVALVCAFGLGLLLSVALLSIPLARRAVPRERRLAWLGYFSGLGLAFIIVEVVLMQRFALFLGHPTYSVTIVLFGILLFSGAGSFWSARWRGRADAVVRPLLWALPATLLLLTFVVPLLTERLIGLPHAARLALAVVFMAPVAFFMGMPFPLGIRAVAATQPAHIAWAWAANGCASVVGSVAATIGAMAWSFSVMLLVAAAIYVAALGLFARSGVEIE